MFIESLEGRQMFSITDATPVDPNSQTTNDPQPPPTVTLDFHITKKVDKATAKTMLP